MCVLTKLAVWVCSVTLCQSSTLHVPFHLIFVCLYSWQKWQSPCDQCPDRQWAGRCPSHRVHLCPNCPMTLNPSISPHQVLAYNTVNTKRRLQGKSCSRDTSPGEVHDTRSEEQTSELQSPMSLASADVCMKK